MRQPLEHPRFPKEAIRKRIKSGVVVAVVQFDGKGKATDTVRLFQWPASVFERAVREAVMEWSADPEDVYVKKGEPFKACSEINFTLQ